MRAAIRGDFERLEERRGEQVLLRLREHEEPAEEDSVTAFEGSDLEVARSDEPLGVPKRSWIDRLLGL